MMFLHSALSPNLGRIGIGTLLITSLAACSDAPETSPPPAACEGFETAFDAYSAGLEKAGDSNLLGLILVDAAPAPPTQGANTWQLQALDADGNPTDDATINDIEPFMPDHGHGASTTPAHNWTGQDGMVEVSGIDFMMPGVWEVRFDVQTADAEPDRVVFAFCIEG